MTFLKTQTDIRGVTTITFDRAEAANAMNREFIDELFMALNKLRSNTRILVIAGNGKHFSAGADINWMKQSQNLSDEQNHADAMALSDMLDELDRFPSPLLACGRRAQASAKLLIADYKTPRIDTEFRTRLAERLASIRTGEEAQEGLSAFIEKRTPDWPI